LSRPANLLGEWLCAGAVALLALLLRALPFTNVFHAGQVVFAPADAMYHVRRSYYTFANWPGVLLSDPYINYPDGAPVPWSPLPDVIAGTIAAAFAGGDAGFERILAWWPAFVGALGALPIYWIARTFASRGVAVLAGGIYALLPISVAYGRVGNPDHHVSAAAVGACLLLVCAKLLVAAPTPGSGESGNAGEESPGWVSARLARLAIGLAVVRAALLLTWHGSLLYIGIAEALLLLSAALTGRREVHAVHALSSLGTLAILLPILAVLPTPLLGLYSSIALSRLHVIAVAAGGVVAFAGWWRARSVASGGDRSGPLARVAMLVGVGVVFLLAVFALPGPREGIEPALRFLTMTDAAGSSTVEQFALFPIFGRSRAAATVNSWGGFAYLIPLAPVALIVWGRRIEPALRPAVWLVAAWAGVFGILALTQLRYGNDVAAAACVGFAIGGEQLRAALARRVPQAVAVLAVAVLVFGLLRPVIVNLYFPWARRAAIALTAGPGEPGPRLNTVGWSLHRFLVAVRAVTPETSGYATPNERPEYGIVSHANLGHALQWVARRATPTDPFWEYIGPENWDRAFGLLAAPSEREAVRLSRELNARYVAVSPSPESDLLAHQLFYADGLRRGRQPALRHFRLVTEGPRGGRPIQRLYEGAGEAPKITVPYKLFEIVPGARLEIAAAAGSIVEASLGVRTPAKREFVFRTVTRADADGIARLHVPYANPSPTASGRSGSRADRYEVRTDPHWEIRVAGEPAGRIVVSEEEIVSGAVIAR